MTANHGRAKLAIDGIVTVAILATCAVLVWSALARPHSRARPELRLPTQPLSLEGAPTKGPRDARAALIVFSDFQCPFCGAFARDLWPELDREYVSSGKVLAAFRHLPGFSIHPLAAAAAAAAVCAGRQGRFWEMHDRLFSLPLRLDADGLAGHAREASVRLDEFHGCISASEAAESVAADANAARAFGISSTPTFFVGRLDSGGMVTVTEAIQGYQPKTVFDNALAKVLKTQ